jgi:hypothetical protein
MAQYYLTTHLNNKWPSKRFNKVDWEHLKLALKTKTNMYKIWHSKQSSSFCGIQVKVGLYSREAFPDERCPNCGRPKMDAYLMLCTDKDKMHLLVDNVVELSKWLTSDNRTDPKLAY